MPKTSTTFEGTGVQAVIHTLKLLESLAQGGAPKGVTQIAVELGTPKMRVFRYLRTLVEHGYARQDPRTERYAVGPRLLRLAEAARHTLDVLTCAKPILASLEKALGQTVILGRLSGDMMEVIDVHVGSSEFAIVSKAGTRLPLHYSGLGKAALAFAPSELVDNVLAGPLEKATPKTITKPAQLRRELEKIRRQRWAQAADEGALGFNALAVPVLGAEGELLACIGVIGGTRAIPAEPAPSMIAKLLQAADEISRGVGATPEQLDR